MIRFEKVHRHGRARYLNVKVTTQIGKQDAAGKRNGRTLAVSIGRIERSRDGIFRFFEPDTHTLNPVLVDNDLKTLKRRIKSHRKQ